jgi:pimeloyl-ACP methyl ester carboxylesterase
MGRSEPSFAQLECVDRASPNRTSLEDEKVRLSSCWAFPGFQLQATDGRRSYHFLEYSGTRQLVQDLWRFREVIGEKRLHVWGISYGTQVMGLYATLFPDETGLFVVDSNVSPIPDMLTFATDTAENLQRRMNYMVSTCEAQNAVSPGACPVPDLGACIAQITRVDPEL